MTNRKKSKFIFEITFNFRFQINQQQCLKNSWSKIPKPTRKEISDYECEPAKKKVNKRKDYIIKMGKNVNIGVIR